MYYTILLDTTDSTVWFCPKCNLFETKEYNLWTDEYIGDNAVLWNQKRFSNLKCPHYRSKEFICPPIHLNDKNLHNRLVEFPCYKELSYSDFIISFPNTNIHSIIGNTPKSDIKIYRVGLLNIRSWGREVESKEYYKQFFELKGHIKVHEDYGNIFLVNKENCLNQDLSHDGTDLFYEGKCRDCGKEHFSFISGD